MVEAFPTERYPVARWVEDAPHASPACADTDAGPWGRAAFMIGTSRAMQAVFSAIRRMGASDAPVLLRGESGTGKELAARAIHACSRFAAGPFVAINCAGLPEQLIASELFGHEKGAFTGALQARQGRIEAAHRGTLLLDEIGDLPLQLQGHLLRFLQERTIERVGSNRSLTIDARIIAATNVDLEQAVREGRFRHDLYYRLNVLSLHLPPLREREGDIELLAEHFLEHFSREMGRRTPRLDADARAALRAYAWPGNIRELISIMRRVTVMTEGSHISTADLGLPGVSAGKAPPPQPLPSLEEARRQSEAAMVAEALRRANGQIKRAAEYLGVSRVTLYRLIQRHGLSTARSPAEP